MAEKPKFYVSERVLAELGEHILLAARRLTDEHGHKVLAPLPRVAGEPASYDEARVFAIGQQALANITGCEIEKRDAIDG
jgi:hypothetical protein